MQSGQRSTRLNPFLKTTSTTGNDSMRDSSFLLTETTKTFDRVLLTIYESDAQHTVPLSLGIIWVSSHNEVKLQKL